MLSRVVAMDCGASRFALAAFSARQDGSLVLEDSAFFPHPSGVGVGTPWIRSANEALQSAGIARRFAGPLFISPPSHETLVKFLKVPQVDESKRAKVIQFEAQQNIPYPLNEVVWSSEPVFDDVQEFEIALVAAKRELMEELCGSVRRAGAMPARIEPASLALHRAFRHNYPDIGGSILLVDIGARMTELVFTNPSRYFVRSVSVGGNTFTQAFADELGQTFDEAELTKVRILGGQAVPTEGSPVALAFEKAAVALANKLSLEITRSTVSVRRHTGGDAPAFVYLTGGGSQIGRLQPLLAEKLRMQVEWFDPFRRVTAADPTAAEPHMHQLCGLIGIAVGAMDRDRSRAGGIDLLPPQVRKATEFRRRQPLILASAVLATAALAMPGIHYRGEANALASEVEAIDSLLARPRAIQARNRENLRLIEEAKTQADAIGALVGTRSNWINFLSDLQRRLANVGDVWIDRLQVIRDTADSVPVVEGMFGAPQPTPEGEVAKVPLRLFVAGRLVDRKNPISKVSQESTDRVRALMASLDESPFVASVDNERYDTTQPGILRFEFTMAVDPERPL
ncbi:MAG TPA: pilus assembly protein PilM [Opitutaceae bacterium]|nr:pilus assembly protein PilM [Opitutaceae bacterium]